MHPNLYKTFKALGILLVYPNEEWQRGLSEICALIAQEGLVTPDDAKAIRAFAEEMQAQNIFDLQESYVDAFDRVRSLSLHLFEHVHGDSRDRGQAMVDLADLYKENGYTLSAHELPDFLPVFLEFLSSLPLEEAMEMLSEPGHVLAALAKRMAERGIPYAAVMNAVVRLSGRIPEQVKHHVKPAAPSFAQLDREWEEKPVEFLGAEAPTGGCGGGSTGACGSGGCGGGHANVAGA